MEVKEKLFLWNFIFESDLIEQIKNDRKMLQNQIASEISDGHVGALFFLDALAEEQEMLTEEIILKVQKMICSEQHLKEGGKKLKKKFLGSYRTIEVSITSRKPIFFSNDHVFVQNTLVRKAPSPDLVPKLMRAWARKVVRWQKKINTFSEEENVKKIADFHFTFEEIHPFVDGNGRVGRALVYCLLKFAKLPIFIFRAHEKNSDYYPALKEREKMSEYFLIRIFHPEKVTEHIETVSEKDAIQF
jgi:Fic family protein